jgi:hypothetical protein
MTIVSASFITIAIAQSGTLECYGNDYCNFYASWYSNYFGLLKIGGYIKYFPYPVVSL